MLAGERRLQEGGAPLPRCAAATAACRSPAGGPTHCWCIASCIGALQAASLIRRPIEASEGDWHSLVHELATAMRIAEPLPIVAKIASGSRAGTSVFIPRFIMAPSDQDLPFELQRRQFSVRPGLAILAKIPWYRI